MTNANDADAARSSTEGLERGLFLLSSSLSLYFGALKKGGVTAEIITRRATRTSVPTGRIHATAKTSSSGRDTHKRSSNSRPSQTAAVRPRGKKLVETP